MISQAVVHGRYHRTMHHNAQDAAFGGSPAPGAVFGLVLDGCGSKHRDDDGVYPSRSEIGAHLLGSFLAYRLSVHLQARPNPDVLHNALLALPATAVAFLQNMLRPISFPNETARTRFIATHLLATLVGFVATPETAVCFWLGDGYLRLNDTVIPLSSDNRPDYLAYRLLPGTNALPLSLLTIRQRARLHTLAAATDGWSPALLAAIDGPQSPRQLQRWLNVQTRHRRHFDDDGAVAICWPISQKAKEQKSKRAEEKNTPTHLPLANLPAATSHAPRTTQTP